MRTTASTVDSTDSLMLARITQPASQADRQPTPAARPMPAQPPMPDPIELRRLLGLESNLLAHHLGRLLRQPAGVLQVVLAHLGGRGVHFVKHRSAHGGDLLGSSLASIGPHAASRPAGT